MRESRRTRRKDRIIRRRGDKNGQDKQGAKKQDNGADKVEKLDRKATRKAEETVSQKPSQGNIREPRFRKQGKKDSGLHRRVLLAQMPETLQVAENEKEILDSKDRGECAKGQGSKPKAQARGVDSDKNMGTRIRRLTPTECERLQGFPDGWTEGISDTQRYKCLGNAVTVNVVAEIVKRLMEQIND